MSELRVLNFSISLDGYGAGPRQSEQDPLGVGGEQLHEWIFDDAATVVDRRFRARGEEGVGATVMGRKVFGPVREGWGTSDRAGWWGEDPPFHHDVFVLTHHPRESVVMAGGTTIGAALDDWRCVEFAPSATVTHVRLRR